MTMGLTLAKNRSKNQSFEWGEYTHSLRLRRTAVPRVPGALAETGVTVGPNTWRSRSAQFRTPAIRL